MLRWGSRTARVRKVFEISERAELRKAYLYFTSDCPE